MAGDVTLGLAFLAGLISFISPCVLPLVPAYVGYMGGRMTHQVAAAQPAESGPSLRKRFGTLTHGLFFVLGFTVFFVIFGLLTTAAISALESIGVSDAQVEDAIARIGGTAVILFGLHIMGVLPRVLTWLHARALRLDRNPYGNLISAVVGIAAIGLIYWLFVESWFMTLVVILLLAQVFRGALKADSAGQFWGSILAQTQTALYSDTRRQDAMTRRYGYAGSFLMGIVFSAGWTPCIGPIYGAVLTLAAGGGSLPEAGSLLTAYSFGLGIPFLLTALALDSAQGLFRRLQRNMRAIEAVSGAFLILIGVLVFSGQLERLTQIGSDQGSLADVSINMENCIVGWVEGRVSLGGVVPCVSDGPKEDVFFATKPPTLLTVAASGEALGSGPPGASESGGSLSVPDFGAPADDAEPLQAPDLAPDDPAADGAEDAAIGFQVGQRAPDFEAELLSGETVSLADYRGQVVLLNFWATWCGPCRDEMPSFETIYQQRKDDGFVILAVNAFEAPDDVRQFVDELDLNFPIALDEAGTVNTDVYGPVVGGYPTSLLLDRDGVIVKRWPGELGASELLRVLTSLTAG